MLQRETDCQEAQEPLGISEAASVPAQVWLGEVCWVGRPPPRGSKIRKMRPVVVGGGQCAEPGTPDGDSCAAIHGAVAEAADRGGDTFGRSR